MDIMKIVHICLFERERRMLILVPVFPGVETALIKLDGGKVLVVMMRQILFT